MSTLSFPKSGLLDPERSVYRKYRLEPGCDAESRECLGWADEPHQHLVVTGHRPPSPELRTEVKTLWSLVYPLEELPIDDDIDDVIRSLADDVEAGPWRYLNAGEVEL